MHSELIIKRLREVASLKVGDPFPEWMLSAPNEWGTFMSELCNAAADEIERLRKTSGKG